MMLPDEERERLLTLYRNRVNAYPGVGADYGQRWRSWCRMLLSRGGSLVVPPGVVESDLDELLARAAVHGPAVRFLLGDAGECHRNVATLWIDGAIESIGTGYGLSDDGLWRQHSWGVDPDGVVVETTDPRRVYVGIVLPARGPSMQFAGSNAQKHLKTVLQRRDERAPELIGMICELAALTRHRTG
ncbi:hypothetical protein [Dactylosporangium sp. NPDC049140]|uniref:hypothetical protein n=1 Tax=Dactylosporangium sp. NPDC049140 TaxID=3155647 RepID=UPI003407861A